MATKRGLGMQCRWFCWLGVPMDRGRPRLQGRLRCDALSVPRRGGHARVGLQDHGGPLVILFSERAVADAPMREVAELLLGPELPKTMAGSAAFTVFAPIEVGVPFGPSLEHANFRHWCTLAVMRQYAELLHLKEMVFLEPVQVGVSEKQRAPVKIALHCLSIVCSLRDICMSVVALRDYFVSLESQTESALPIERLENYLTPLLAFLLQTSTDLEELLHDKLSRACETCAVASLLPVTMATLLPWRSLIATLSGRFVDRVLQQCDVKLRAEVRVMRSALPGVAACFKDKVFLEEMSKGVLCGTVPTTKAAHNELHQVMSKISNIGQKLNISPGLDAHEITKSAVAIARSALQEAKDATVYAEGAEALRQGQSADGVKLASAHLVKYGQKYTHLEGSFWDQVRELAHYNGPAGAAPRKAEVAARSEVSLAGSSAASSSSLGAPSSSSSSNSVASAGSGMSTASTRAPSTVGGAPRQKKGFKRASTMMEDA